MDGRRRRRRRRQPPARVRPAGRPRGQRAAAAARRPTPRAAARRTPRRPTSSARCEERAPGDDRGRMLAQLGDGRLRRRPARLAPAPARGAARGRTTARAAIDVLTRLAALNVVDVGDAGLAELFERELASETDPDVRLAVEAAALDTLMTIPERHDERARRLGRDRPRRDADPLLARVVLAHRAWVGIELGTPDAATCGALAREALDGDLLLRRGRPARGLPPVRPRARPDRRTPTRRARRSRGCATTRSRAARCGCAPRPRWYAAELALRTRPRRRGRERRAPGARPRRRRRQRVHRRRRRGARLRARRARRVRRGARAAARARPRRRARRRDLGDRRAPRARAPVAGRGRLRARATPRRCAVGALRERAGPPEPDAGRRGARPPRSRSPTSGRREEAVALADAELALAERFGAPVADRRARCTRAPSPSPTTPRASRCASARWPSATASPALLETRARCGSSSAARWPTWAGASRRATRCARRWPTPTRLGAVLLAERARRELVATGLRPRQAAIEGAAALTPRQRQVCELAAAGKGNRADRPGAVPERQDRRDAPRRGLPQARRQHPRGPGPELAG